MNSHKPDVPESDLLEHDGVQCPRQAPWPWWSWMITGLPFIIIPCLAFYALWPDWPWTLVVWGMGFVAFLIPLRWLVCARCPYYGQFCSTILGRVVPFIFKRQEGRSMRLGLWLDVVAFVFLFFVPLRAMASAGILTVFGWCLAFLLMILLITRYGCSYCPFTFCPIGKTGRLIWARLGR